MAKQGPEAIPTASIERGWFRGVLGTLAVGVVAGGAFLGVQATRAAEEVIGTSDSGREIEEPLDPADGESNELIPADEAKDRIRGAMNGAGLHVLSESDSGIHDPGDRDGLIRLIQDMQDSYARIHEGVVTREQAAAIVACSFLVHADEGVIERGATQGRIADIESALAQEDFLGAASNCMTIYADGWEVGMIVDSLE